MDLLVTVYTLVYNHEPYIRQCLDGLVMQKTNFKYECFVHDDASTDDSATIIREYADKFPDIIRPMFEIENQWSKHDGSLDRIIRENLHGKYIAICEGDDYWTDPYKLQKQVDYMETNPDCGLIYTDYSEFIQKSQTMKNDMIKSGRRSQINSFQEHLLKAAYIAPPSWLYRRETKAMEEYKKNKRFVDGTFSLALEFFQHSQVFFMQETTCVYRVLDNSASHHTSAYKRYLYAKGIFDEQLFFCNKYNVNPAIRNKICQRFYRKYYAQILSYEEQEQKRLLKLESKNFDPSSLNTWVIKNVLSSSILTSLFTHICKIRYPK